MSRLVSLGSRRLGRGLAALGGVLVLALGAWTAVDQSVPEVGIVDGYWMLGGAAVAFLLVAPLAWRWPRERALPAVTVATAVGSWLPLVGLALRAGVPVRARLKGAIFFSSADVIGLALPVGCALLWLALQEHHDPSRQESP